MSTIYEYLDKKREDNPELYIYGDYDLYQKLKTEDPNIPSWDKAEKKKQKKVSGQKAYQRKQDPNFANSLFDWTDWSIDENSSDWAKSAYNTSITGLAYQMYNGEQRFDLDNYNPGMAEDIFSAVLSFMMPMDIATMWLGSSIGRVGVWGGSKLAGEGFKKAAIENLVKMGAKEGGKTLTKKQLAKETAKQLGKRTAKITSYVDDMLSEGSYNALFSQFAPKAAGAIGQGVTLATFEGTRGGMQAAVNGEDVWEGIGHGVMHGGIMGGAAGFVGASLNLTHSKLFQKSQKESLTRKEMYKKIRTGIAGQVAAEAGIFTAPEVIRIAQDEDASFKDLLRSYFTNVGMMGILKAQKKAEHKLWDKGKDSLRKFMVEQGIIEVQAHEISTGAHENLKKVVKENKDEAETPEQKEIAAIQGEAVNQFVDNSLSGKKHKVTKEEYEKWEKEYDDATKLIESIDDVTIKQEKIDKILNVYKQVQKVYGAMKSNIDRYKKDNPDAITARKGKLKEMEDLAAEWKEKIIDPLNNISNVQKVSTPLSDKQRSEARMSFRTAFEDAKKRQTKGDKSAMEELVRDLDGVDLKTGEVTATDNVALIKLKERAEVYKKEYLGKEIDVKVSKADATKDVKFEEFKTEETDAFGKEVDDKLLDIRESDRTPKSKGLASEVVGFEGEIKDSTLDEKIHRDPKNKFTFNPNEAQAKKYEESKDVLSYIATELARKKNPIENASEHLQIADKFARFLAKKDKSLLEIEDKFIEEYVFDNPASHKSAISNMVKAISDISSKYPGIMKKGFSLNTGERIGDLYRERKMGDKVEGILSTDAELSPTVINEKGTITIGTKTVPKIKPITKTLAKMLKALNLRAKINKKDGHKDFLMTDTKGEALIDVDANFLFRKYFGPRIQKSGGEARAFRYSLEQYAKAKWGENSTEFHMIDKYSIGHGADPKVSKRYSDAVEAKGGVDTFTRELIREYLKDIKKGNYKDVSGKTVSMKNLKKGIRQSGYYPEEIKKGLEKIENAPDIINYKVGEKDKSIDKSTLEAMAKFAIETGPRIREIVPTQKTLEATIEFGHQTISDSYLKGEKMVKGFAESKEFQDQIKITEKLYPKFTVNLKKSLKPFRGSVVIGRIRKHIIDIAKGLVQPDTLPHEISHNAIDILKATGTPYSKKLIKEAVKLFGSEEAFVDALGKFTAKSWRGKSKDIGELKFYNNKSLMGKMKSWVRRTMFYLGDYFGIRNPQDVARMQAEAVDIIGKKIAKGEIPTDYMPTELQIKTHYMTKETPEMKSTRVRVVMKEKNLMEGKFNYTKKELREIFEDVTGGKTKSLKTNQDNPYSLHELERYERRLQSLFEGEIKNKTKKQSVNESYLDDTIKTLETKYDITDEVRNNYFKTVHKTTVEKANSLQMKSYRAYVIKGSEVGPTGIAGIDGLISLNKNRKNNGIALWKRALMTSGDVVRIYGGEAGKKIANALDLHDHTRTTYKGYGEDKINDIIDIVDKNVRNKYMHMIDPILGKHSIDSLKKMIKEYPNNYKYKREYSEMIEAYNKFHSKNGDYAKAGKIWGELTNYYWKHLGLEILRNTKGQREYDNLMAELNSKYIKQYFTRRPTKDVIEFLKKDSPQIQKLVDSHVKDLTIADLKRAVKSLDLSKEQLKILTGDTKLTSKSAKEFKKSKEVRDLVAEEIMAMIEFGPAKVKPSFLKKRGIMLDEYIEITKDNGTKHMVKAYETSLDGTMSHYVGGMSKFLATVRHFPEFTELSGKFSLRASQKINILKSMEKSNTMGAYAYELVKRQLGMDYSMKDALMNPVLNWSGKVTNLSAVIGLSSPTAGIKNLLIQIPRSVAVYGARNTLRGMSLALRSTGLGIKSLRDPKLYKEAVLRGETGFGTKEVIREAGQKKYVKFVFDKVNFMTQTENFNRIMLAEAGKLHFMELLNVARGNKSLFHPEGTKEEVLRMFRETYKLTDADIKYLVAGENVIGTTKFNEMLNFVGHQSHKAGAGATGVADLPLWFSGKYARPLTLFQRMAMSVTIDSYKNYIKPIKNGNLAPIIKASIGHGLAGAVLFQMYDTLLGQQPPKEESPFLDRAMANIWRGEFLGVFGEILSPYDKPGLSSPIMEPVIIRNARVAGEEALQWLEYGKGLDEATKDWLFKSVVGFGQLEKMWNKRKHPYVTDTKRIKTLQRQWQKQMGYEQVQQGQFISQRTPFYWKLKESIMFGKSEEEIARTYYASFNYICTELENVTNITSKTGRIKQAQQSIDSVIRHMNPINVSDNVQYRTDAKRNEFLKWLSSDNKELALKLEKEFKYKERVFRKIIRQGKWKTKYSIYPY